MERNQEPNQARNIQLEVQRAANRHYQTNYRHNSPEKRVACLLRYYARKLTAAGYTVTEPAAAGRPIM